jgi:hypothetical protein
MSQAEMAVKEVPEEAAVEVALEHYTVMGEMEQMAEMVRMVEMVRRAETLFCRVRKSKL